MAPEEMSQSMCTLTVINLKTDEGKLGYRKERQAIARSTYVEREVGPFDNRLTSAVKRTVFGRETAAGTQCETERGGQRTGELAIECDSHVTRPLIRN